MASIKDLNAIAGKHDTRANPKKGSALMQHSRGANEHRVEISEREPSGKRSSQYAPRNNAGRTERVKNPAVNRTPDNSALIEHQTDIMKSQGVAVQKQSQVLNQQTSIMHDQVRATKDVSAVVERLYEYMQKEGNKLTPKLQQSGQGNTYEGQFERMEEKRQMRTEQRQRRREISDDLRRQRSERARGMDRDERGRFRGRKKGIIPKIQEFGGRLGGGRLGGGAGGMGGGGALMRAAGPLLALATAFYGGKAMEAASDNYRYDVKGAGTVARGWQSTKDTVGDALGGIGDDQMAQMAQNPKFAGDIAGATKKAKSGGLGSMSAYFESGNRGVETISSGKGDNGGVSYGTHQLSSKSGMNSFLRSEEGSKYYNQFRGMTPGSKEFNEKYLDVVKGDKEGMEGAQGAFIKKTHYDPLSKWVDKQYGIDVAKRSRAVQELIYSLSVQHGQSGAQDIISQAFGNRDAASMNDKEIIDRIQKYRTYNVESLFRSSDVETKTAMQERGWKETAALNNVLETENSGKGSVAGSNYNGMGSAMTGSSTFADAQKSFGGKPNVSLAAGNGGSGGGVGAGNGSMLMAPGGGSASGASGNADEAGANAGVDFQDNGNFFNIGVKNVVPADSSVNLAGLNPKFQKAFFTMVGDWVTNFGGGTVTSASAFRTRAEQEALWVKYGRNTKRVARPGTSRHESGFAIDIDRNSAGKLEQSGMFKKYGFHRPLSNEPWHVEMVGAGKGGAAGVSTTGSAPSPQVMQKAAEQELNKVGETQVVSAEEGTRQAVTKEGAKAEAEVKNMQSEIAGGADPTTTGEPPAAGKEKGAFADDAVNVSKSGQTDKMDSTNRTPEQQAMYEQYLKSAGGDPRKVPDAFTNPAAYGLNAKDAESQKVMKPGEPIPPVVTAGQVALDVNGNPYEDLNYRGGKINTMAPGTTGSPGQVALDVNGNPYEDLNYRGGKINTMATPAQQVQRMPTKDDPFPNQRAQQQGGDNPFGANPNGPVMGPNGTQKEPGLLEKFGITPSIHQSGAGVGGGINAGVLGGINANQGVRGKGSVYYTPPSASGVMGKLGIPGMGGQIGGIVDGLTRGQKPGKDSMIDMAATAAIGGLFSLGQDRPKPMEPTVSPVQSFTSPASPSYYANEQPIVAKAASVAPASVMPVQTTAAPVESTRQAYDPVQSVNVVSAPPQQSAPSSAPSSGGSGAGGGKGSGGGNDLPQLDEIPAMLDDYGLLFINSGYC